LLLALLYAHNIALLFIHALRFTRLFIHALFYQLDLSARQNTTLIKINGIDNGSDKDEMLRRQWMEC
jgi:hypothetical protein